MQQVDWNAPMEEVEKIWKNNWEEINKKNEGAKIKGNLLGRYMSEGYADGAAYYEIIVVKKQKVIIRVLTGIGDDWIIPYWGEETTIDKNYAINHLC